MMEWWESGGERSLVISHQTYGARQIIFFHKSGKYLPIIGDFMDVGAGLRARPFKISFSYGQN
jgi:hypothetical protein